MLPDPLRAHLPWSRLDEFLPLLLKLHLTPEIAFTAVDLDTLDPSRVTKLASRLADSDMLPTVHAPFFDLNPGTPDSLIRQVTLQRLLQTCQVADQINAHLVVVHPGFDHWRYPGSADLWLEFARPFFLELLAKTAGSEVRLAIENIFETTPHILDKLVTSVASPRFGHCLDVGHCHLFGQSSLEIWLTTIAPRLLHVHLHDNHGSADEHLPVGDGQIDFRAFFSSLSQVSPLPSITLEAHHPDDLTKSLHRLRSLWPGFSHHWRKIP